MSAAARPGGYVRHRPAAGRIGCMPLRIGTVARAVLEAVDTAPAGYAVRLVIDADGRHYLTTARDPQVLPGTVGIYTARGTLVQLVGDIRTRLAELSGRAAA